MTRYGGRKLFDNTVRIYTAKNIREELEEAQHDFNRASVGIRSRGKLLVHCFAKSFVDDSNLAVWISHTCRRIRLHLLSSAFRKHGRGYWLPGIVESCLSILDTAQDSPDCLLMSIIDVDYRASQQDAIRPTTPLDDKKAALKMDNKLVQHLNPKLPKEMVKCMKNIFISLSDSPVSDKSSPLESQSSPVSLSNSSWWSSFERSILSSWAQSPKVDVQSNGEVLSSENGSDPYRVRGKLSWADIGNYGLATQVSWMSGALRNSLVTPLIVTPLFKIYGDRDE
ncbi:hypothetical protein LINGRAHAP2_LOCUS13604 [Linum grandiflorum]